MRHHESVTDIVANRASRDEKQRWNMYVVLDENNTASEPDFKTANDRLAPGIEARDPGQVSETAAKEYGGMAVKTALVGATESAVE